MRWSPQTLHEDIPQHGWRIQTKLCTRVKDHNLWDSKKFHLNSPLGGATIHKFVKLTVTFYPWFFLFPWKVQSVLHVMNLWILPNRKNCCCFVCFFKLPLITKNLTIALRIQPEQNDALTCWQILSRISQHDLMLTHKLRVRLQLQRATENRKWGDITADGSTGFWSFSIPKGWVKKVLGPLNRYRLINFASLNHAFPSHVFMQSI